MVWFNNKLIKLIHQYLHADIFHSHACIFSHTQWISSFYNIKKYKLYFFSLLTRRGENPFVCEIGFLWLERSSIFWIWSFILTLLSSTVFPASTTRGWISSRESFEPFSIAACPFLAYNSNNINSSFTVTWVSCTIIRQQKSLFSLILRT